jgi:cytochrome oxidase Cu insertion factor (SCO1/SenC/PrrC family)
LTIWRKLSIILWTLVLVAVCIWFANQMRERPPVISVETGPLFKKLPWKHLPDVAPFELTTIDGTKFDSRQLAGHPYAVNFFFSTCPTICRQLNEQVRILAEQFRNDDLTFLSITVDPSTDTPERLAEYAKLFDAAPQKWKFLTGELSTIQQLGDQSFRVRLEKEVHTEEIVLVDRWGRFRDRFRWDDPAEMRRFAAVATQVIGEQQPPLEDTVETRNLMAGIPHTPQNSPPWLNEFFLLQSDGTVLYSRDLIGQVWIGSIFFSTCTTHCLEQNRYLRDLQERLGDRPVRIVSVTTDPQTDTPARLQLYAQEMKAQPNRWLFLTADEKSYAHRVAAEYFGLFVQGSDHATDLAIIDRWGRVRKKFNWRDPSQEAEMFKLVDELVAEEQPPQIAAQDPTPTAAIQ